MKKFIRNNLFGFILGAVIFSSIGVVAYTINARDVSFHPANSNWKVNNLEEAVNDLYKGNNNFNDYELVLQQSEMTNNPSVYNLPTDYKELLLIRFYYSSSKGLNNNVLIKNTVNCSYERLAFVGRTSTSAAVSVYKITDIGDNATVEYAYAGDLFVVLGRK